jgi:hypothetical protein
MRRILLCLIVILAAVLAGCTQPATTTAPPVLVHTPVVTPSPTAVISTAVPYRMQINVTAKQTNNDVIVQYNGGADATYLTALRIRIDNNNGQTVDQTMNYPQPGAVYTFPYMGTPDADRVNVVGIFTGGSQQTVLLTYV